MQTGCSIACAIGWSSRTATRDDESRRSPCNPAPSRSPRSGYARDLARSVAILPIVTLLASCVATSRPKPRTVNLSPDRVAVRHLSGLTREFVQSLVGRDFLTGSLWRSTPRLRTTASCDRSHRSAEQLHGSAQRGEVQWRLEGNPLSRREVAVTSYESAVRRVDFHFGGRTLVRWEGTQS